jgi:hypothetical protein
MTIAPARRLKTYRSPGPMPGLRRYGRRKSGLVCSTHALQARTSKRSSSASGVLRRADCVYSDCIAFAGILRRDRSAAALLLRLTQPGSVRMPCSAVALPRHPANDPTWVMAHECGLVNSRQPGHVTQLGPHHSHGDESPLRLPVAQPVPNDFWSLPWLPITAVTQPGSRRAHDSAWVMPQMGRAFRLTQPRSCLIKTTAARNSRSPRLAPQWGCDMT